MQKREKIGKRNACEKTGKGKRGAKLVQIFVF